MADATPVPRMAAFLPGVPPRVAVVSERLLSMLRYGGPDYTLAAIAASLLRRESVSAAETRQVLAYLDAVGMVGPFLRLATKTAGPELRDHLLSRGVSWLYIHEYYEASGWDVAQFMAGAVFGVGQSIADILIGLATIAKTVVMVPVDAILTEGGSVSAAFSQLKAFLANTTVQGVIELPGKAFDQWQAEVFNLLYQTDFFNAGRLVGKLIADVVQFATLVAAAPRIAGRALSMVGDFAAFTARSARTMSEIAPVAARMLVTIGRELIEAAPRLLDPRVLGDLLGMDKLEAWLAKGGWSFFDEALTLQLSFAPAEATSAALGGSIFGNGGLVLGTCADRLVFTVLMAQRIKDGKGLVKEVMAALDRIDPRVPRLPPPRRQNVETARRIMAAIGEGRIDITALRAALDFVRNEVVRLAEAGVGAAEIGTRIHKMMEDVFLRYVKAQEGRLRAFVEVTPTKLAAQYGMVPARPHYLELTVEEFLTRHRDVAFQKVNGMEADLSNIRRLFGDTADTKLKDLRFDALVLDESGLQAAIIDWGSDRNLGEWARILDEIGTPLHPRHYKELEKFYVGHLAKTQMYSLAFEYLFTTAGREIVIPVEMHYVRYLKRP